MLTNHYWWIPEALTPQQCDEIQHVAASEQQIEGIHFGANEEHRKSQISWIYNEKLNDLIAAWIRQANKETGWSFDLQTPEALQYTRYGVDGYYDWHTDGNSDNHAARRLLPSVQVPDPIPLNVTPFPELQGTVRKLSATVNLSHSSDYEGGELQIRCYDQLHIFNDAPRGSIAVFPSFMEHRITPVTQGERHSAVMWFNGYPFR